MIAAGRLRIRERIAASAEELDMTDEYMVRMEIRPKSLDGISEDQIAQHWALYEGYVKNVNLLDDMIEHLSKNEDYGVDFAELKRRQGFEYNGMILHEHYFAVLKAKQAPLNKNSDLSKRLDACFGGFAAWKKQFTAMGHMRGTGWVILYHDSARDLLTNVWISSHEEGHPAGFTPILVMDVWEHAYMVDWGAAGRPEYIEKFFQNVNWAKIDGALRDSCHAILSHSTR
jgi:Fe-Mn family superoxide dismutase